MDERLNYIDTLNKDMTEDIVFHKELTDALEIAKKIAHEFRHPEYAASHLLKAILNRDLSLLKLLEAMGKDVFFIEEWADVRLEEIPRAVRYTGDTEAHKSIDDVIMEADNVRDILDREEVDLFCIVVALATPGVGFNFDQMKSFPVSRSELLHEHDSSLKQDLHELPTERAITKFIYKYCRNKTAKTNQPLPEIVGREEELKQITEILCRFSKPNVLLLGYPGVGKSAVIEGFVNLIKEDKVPEKLSRTELFELDLATLIAGASYKGEIEDRLKKVIQELRTFPKAILIIDDIHLLLDKNSDNAGISSLLKSETSKGITLIATTTIDEYTKKIEKDEGLSGMFETLKIEEPNEEMAFRMIQGALGAYHNHHHIQVNDETIREAIRLSKRYLKEKSLPESALNLLDRTMSVIKTSGETFLKEKTHLLKQLERIREKEDSIRQLQEIQWFSDDLTRKAHYLLTQEPETFGETSEKTVAQALSEQEALLETLTSIAQQKKEHIVPIDLAAIVSQKTGIPIGKLQSEEKDRLQSMESILKQRVVGQDLAIQVVSEAVLESRSGLNKSGQPIGSFFLSGPTGTGKTELAKALADFLFQDENAIIRFDMSEFKEEHSAALLYGAPPGYVGYEEGGLLVNKIRQKPYSIVLFDEIEKAHSSVFDVFLQIMDEGKLHDRLGKEGDFSNALILFTSNIGSDFITELANKGQVPTANQLTTLMARYFRPEFLGRLTEIIPFKPISKENAMRIFDIHLKKDLLDILKDLEIEFTIQPEAKEYMVAHGFNAAYGARPLRGIIRSELRRPLARKIVSGEVKEKSHIAILLNNNNTLLWNVKN